MALLQEETDIGYAGWTPSPVARNDVGGERGSAVSLEVKNHAAPALPGTSI